MSAARVEACVYKGIYWIEFSSKSYMRMEDLEKLKRDMGLP
jgi:hypothetical protein